MTQWRPLIFIMVGFSIIYLASLLQDPPFIRPKSLHVADRAFFTRKPDDIILSAAGPYLYMSAVWKEGEYPEKNGIKRGTGPHAVGVRGRVKQYRAPLEMFRSNSRVVEAEAGWEELFEEDLNGLISLVSKHPDQISPPSAPGKTFFSILYQEIDGEDIKNIARVYYLSLPNDDASNYARFHYKEYVLHGSTWVSAMSLEEGMLIYTRDPDRFYFRTLPLTIAVYAAPHDESSKRIVAPPGIEGKVMRGVTQTSDFLDYHTLIARLYAPQENSLRVVALRAWKLPRQATLNVTIMDNVTSPDILDAQKNDPANNWVLRERADISDNMQHDEDYNPISDNPYYQPERTVTMPKLAAARSASLKTLMYPFRSSMISIDYVEDFNLLNVHEKWSEVVDLWTRQSKGGKLVGGVFVDSHYSTNIVIPSVDGNYEQEFQGVQLNADGNICAAWSDFNNIFLYKRGFADPDRRSEVLRKKAADDEEERQIRAEVITILDMRWSAPWGITWFSGHPRTVGVASVEIWNATRSLDTTPNNVLLVAMKDGRVHSFALDHSEEQSPVGIWSFITQRWDMLTVMVGTIGLFVFNEVKNHPPVE